MYKISSKISLNAFIIATLFSSHNVLAHENDSKRVDGHAPIGVMADHSHKKGELMFSYREVNMNMRRNFNGSDKMTTQEVLDSGYMMAPVEMTGKMHMLGAMYAPSDKVTLVAMVPVIEKEMTMQMKNGNMHTTSTNGVGDIKVGALFPTPSFAHGRTQVGLSVSLPTGSIDQKVTNAMGQSQHAPYGMQLGSGSYSLQPSATWIKQVDTGSFGVQTSAVIRTGKNDNGYQLGDKYEVTTWASKIVHPRVSLSTRIKATSQDNIEGSDEKIMNAMMSPGLDTSLRGGKTVEAAFGANLLVDKIGRLGVEVSKPVYQKLDGPQLGKHLSLTLGWQKQM